MLWFMARDTANGGIEQRDNAVLDVICPLIADASSRPRWAARPAAPVAVGCAGKSGSL
jgi:hypothetical protein